MIRSAAVGALFVAILSGSAAHRVSAQDAAAADTTAVDRIAAVVGNKAILRSQVTEEVYARIRDGRERVPDGKVDPSGFEKAMIGLMRRYVDTLVAFELLHVEAVQDTTVKVTDQEVAEAVDQLIASARKGFKSDAEFRSQLAETGFATLEDYRKWWLDKQRRAMTVQRYEAMLKEDQRIKEMTPTAKEVRAFYDLHKNDFGMMPANISFKQIVVAPKANPVALAKAKALADSLIIELRKGADFATLARAFTMDEASKADGGSLPWFSHGRMVREFEDAAFSLKPGTISDAVESPYGYHIIQVQRVQPGEVQARHILIIPEIDSAGAAAAQAKAVSLSEALGRGASFDSLQHLYHDRAEELELNMIPMDTLAHTPYGPPLAGVDSGKVSAAFMLPAANQPLHSKWAVAQVIRRVPAGALPFDDVRANIKRLLGIMLGEQDYINRLRAKTYVDIRDP